MEEGRVEGRVEEGRMEEEGVEEGRVEGRVEQGRMEEEGVEEGMSEVKMVETVPESVAMFP